MSKMKTHKGLRKRFRITASGKMKRQQAGKKHLNGPKTGKRKRQLRAEVIATDRIANRYIEQMGGSN